MLILFLALASHPLLFLSAFTPCSMGADLSRFIEEERGSKSINLEQKRLLEIPAEVAELKDHLQR